MRLFVLTTDYEWLEIDIADNDNVVKGVKWLNVPSDLERTYKTKLLHPDTMITLQNLLDRNILDVYLIKDNIRTVHDIYNHHLRGDGQSLHMMVKKERKRMVEAERKVRIRMDVAERKARIRMDVAEREVSNGNCVVIIYQ